jgi:hypothetical protein
MGVSRQQMPDESTRRQALRGEVREQRCPPGLVSEWVTKDHAWEEHERSLTHLLLVYNVIARFLCRRLTPTEVLGHLARGLRWLWSHPCRRLSTAAVVVSCRRP